jgi:uncharacterized protein YjbJ (UPF0337 family)
LDEGVSPKENHMNLNRPKSKWDQIKKRAKKAWGELTDDDFKRADGSVDKLHDIIEKKFGDTKESIRAKLDKLRLN